MKINRFKRIIKNDVIIMNKSMFNIKERKNKKNDTVTETCEAQEESTFQKKPLICLIDLESEIRDNLLKKGFNIASGTLGEAIKVPNEPKYPLKYHKCLANYCFPMNLHEYDIIILDLQDKEPIPYNITEHTHENVEGSSKYYFCSEYPETLFNPRYHGSFVLRKKIEENNNHPVLIITFAVASNEKEYYLIEDTVSGIKPEKNEICGNYSFCSRIPWSINKSGTELVVQKESFEFGLYKLLNKYIEGTTYHIVFQDPEVDGNSELFVPLIENSQKEIVSFLRIFQNQIHFVFPQISDKSSFLCELLTDQLPTIWPAMFPYNSKFKWLEEEAYMLPNEELLLYEKESLIKKYEEEIENKDLEIESNHQKYKCLHCLLTESGNTLVECVKNFLEWLGFEDVKIMDEELEGRLDEDLQVETEDGLLVIEIKGIGGTSRDEECSQIEKIKNRRMRERESFDVFGLYIVNHQRYQPPLIRKNPPFKQQQIEDAENERRGLLTTWQLFNLYYSIKNKCISKEEARKTLLKFGLIEFSPQDCISLGKPKNLFYEGEVIALDLEHKIETNGELIIKRGDRYLKTKILEIQVHSKRVEVLDSGPAGIKVDISIKKSDELFQKRSH